MERSEEHRQKKELNELLDRGLSVSDKYGGERGWRLLLRHNEDRKDEVFQFREQVGCDLGGIESRNIDDRWKPVEIIRKNKEFNTPRG